MNLTPKELELLSALMEECGEVIQACSKIIRHGKDSYRPNDETKTTNMELLKQELLDVDIIRTLITATETFPTLKYLDEDDYTSHFQNKFRKKIKYFHFI